MRLNSAIRLAGAALGGCLFVGWTTVSLAGPYAALAQVVQANGGVLVMYSDASLENADEPTQNAAAISACHAVTSEGVSVISVQIVGMDGQTVVRTIGQDVIAGC